MDLKTLEANDPQAAEDGKKMLMMERRIRALAVQKKVSPRAYFCALVSILCDLCIKLGIPLEALIDSVESNYAAIQAEHEQQKPTKH